jgi:hypothetical protein
LRGSVVVLLGISGGFGAPSRFLSNPLVESIAVWLKCA